MSINTQWRRDRRQVRKSALCRIAGITCGRYSRKLHYAGWKFLDGITVEAIAQMGGKDG